VVGQLWVGLQLLGEPLPQNRARNRGSVRDLVGVDAPRMAPPFESALYGRQGDSEELCDLPSRDPAVDGGEHFQSEVLLVEVFIVTIFMQVSYLRRSGIGYRSSSIRLLCTSWKASELTLTSPRYGLSIATIMKTI
jgi:hypothetical protein